MAFGLSLDQLVSVYDNCFPVLQSYEASTFYDENGRPALSGNKVLSKLTLSRSELIKKHGMDWETMLFAPGSLRLDVEQEAHDAEPGSSEVNFVFPIHNRDRRSDYRDAWNFFMLSMHS